MTTNQSEDDLVVVDGSNIATEGRSMPSLTQLNEAVLSFREEYPDVNVTVVVDATFGHRIDKSEVAEFDAAVAHNELVAPPAGAVGRGDAFVLSIAHKSGARILSNDSFQEFHGTYPWLFDEGRLIGGKPVPYVGWVFVTRVPVKGPVSRKARAGAGGAKRASRPASKLASLPMPVPTSPPPSPATQTERGSAQVDKPEKGAKSAAQQKGDGRGRSDKAARTGRAGRSSKGEVAKGEASVTSAQSPVTAAPERGGPVNELLPFLDFVEHHPIGSSVTGMVESYSSHGAYVTVGDLRGYVPLRLMGSPPPRSAREVLKQGEMVTLVVDNFAPGRRSVDLALPGFGSHPTPAPKPVAPVAEEPAAKKPAAKKAASKRATATPTLVETAPATKAAASRTPAKKTPAIKAPAKKAAAAKVPAEKAGADKAPAKKAPAEKVPAKKVAAAKGPVKKAAAAKVPAKKAAAKKAAAKKAAPRKRAAAGQAAP